MISKNIINCCWSILILFSSTLFAQSTTKLHGVVVDEMTNKPLVGANIVIEGSGIGAVSDYNGQFKIENLLDGVYTVSASYIGYNQRQHIDVRISKDHPIQLHFRLTPQVIPLQAVEVTAERIENPNTTNTWTISRETIERTNTTEIAELIKLAPGIDVQDAGNVAGAKKISIRGSQTNQVLVLVDGVPLNDQLGGDADISKIPVNVVEKIEIYKGGGSARFGSGAIGGVINITTRKAFQNEIKLNSTFGAFQMMMVEPIIAGSYRQIGYFLSYQYTSSQGDYPYEYVDSRRQTIHEHRKNADALLRNFFGRLSFGYKGHAISLQYQRLLSDRGFPGKIDGWTPYARTDYQQSLLGLDYEFKLPALEITLNSNWSDAATTNRNLYPDNVELRYKRYPQYHYQYNVRNILSGAILRYFPSRWFQLSTGYTYRHLRYDDENLQSSFDSAIQTATDNTHGVFLSQEWTLNLPWLSGKFILTPAVRFDYMTITNDAHDHFKRQWSPAGGTLLSFGASSQIYVRASVAKSFRAPTFADLFYQDVRVKGKPDLLPEKSDNIDISAGGQLTKAGLFRCEITHFHYNIEDLIVWRLGSFEVFSPFNNDADISGQEYLVAAQMPHDLLNLELSYSRIEPLNKLDNQTTLNKILPYRPQRLLKAALSTTYQNFFLKVNYNFIGKRFVNEANTQFIDSYQNWNADINWNQSIKHITITLKLSMLNFTDVRYMIVRDMPMPGREWRIGVGFLY